jgi:hypothetical protein
MLRNVAVELVGYETSGINISARSLAILTEVIGNILSPATKIMSFNSN